MKKKTIYWLLFGAYALGVLYWWQVKGFNFQTALTWPINLSKLEGQ